VGTDGLSCSHSYWRLVVLVVRLLASSAIHRCRRSLVHKDPASLALRTSFVPHDPHSTTARMRLNTLLLLVLPLAAHARKARRSELTDCLTAAAAPIVLPSDAGWADETVPYNLRFAPAPSAVVVPRTQAEVRPLDSTPPRPRLTVQVQSAVRCASIANVRVSVKSGGHSYGAYGLAGALVIDMVEFQSVTLDRTTQIATVGAGVRLGNLATKLFQLGGRASVPPSPTRWAARC